MADIEEMVGAHEYNLPHDSAVGMLIFAAVQELATWVHNRNLRQCVDEHGDPALSHLLKLIAVDERAHHAFYTTVVRLFLELDRKETLEQLRRVLLTFAMPAVHLLAESKQRGEAIKGLGIFDEDISLHEVNRPVREVLAGSHRERPQPNPARKSTAAAKG